jgi:YbbR domain-containing protein
MRSFRRERRRAARRRELPRVSWGDVGAWLVAFVTAIGLWLFVNTGERTSERTLRVRIEPENLPAGLVITNPVTEYVEVRVSGPGVILSGIDPKRLRTPLDLSFVRPGVATYAISPKMFQFPRKVEVVRVTPAQVSLHVDRETRRTLPVRLERQGQVPAGYSVSALELTPDEVEVVGPASQLEGLRTIATEPLDLSRVGEGRDVYLRLVSPGDGVALTPSEILAHVETAPVVAEREIKAVAVTIRGDAAWKANPARIALTVRGPESKVASLELGPGSVYVDASGLAPPGPHRVRPSVVLPEGVEVLRQAPGEVSLQAAVPAKRRGGGARKAESRRD